MKKQQFIKQSKAQVCSFNFTHYSFTHWRASLMNRVFSLHKAGTDHVSSELIYHRQSLILSRELVLVQLDLLLNTMSMIFSCLVLLLLLGCDDYE